jgi:hypothetical protein
MLMLVHVDQGARYVDWGALSHRVRCVYTMLHVTVRCIGLRSLEKEIREGEGEGEGEGDKSTATR